MDRMAWEDQHREQQQEKSYQAGLDRARTGEAAAAYQTGVQAQEADPTSSMYKDPSLTALARGGRAQARRPYLVGEKGPELMIPDQNGTIVPNHKLRHLQALARRRGVVARARGGRVLAGGDPAPAPTMLPGERMAAERAPNLAAAGAELGAPTSYNGGEGAPQPVEVVRGARTTFTNPAPDTGNGGYNPNASQNTQEYGSLIQAKQAFNRGQGEDGGEYVPPEGPKLEAAAAADVAGYRAYHLGQAKVQEAAAAAEKLGVDKSAYRTNFIDEHGIMDQKTKALALPPDENLNRIYKAGETHINQGMAPKDAMSAIAPDLHSHYYTPENVDKALAIISQQTGQPVTPEWRAKALENTPAARAQMYPYIQKALRAPKPGMLQRIGSGLSRAGEATADQF